MLSDSTLLDALRDAFADAPEAPRAALIDTAAKALCKRFRLRSDADRENIAGRMSAIWAAHFMVTEPN